MGLTIYCLCQAMLGYAAPNSSEVRYLCDATLISEDTLLAAGHCLRQTK